MNTALSFRPVEALRQAGDDDVLLEEIIRLFLEDNPKREADVRAALERKDASLLERAAHTIKGSCVIFGANDARDAAHELERLGQSGAFEPAEAAFGRLASETRRLVADLQAYLVAKGK